MDADDLARGRATALLETLADAEHTSWSRWMEYLMGRCERHVDGSLTIPAALVERWRHQAATPYADLSEREKEADREEVRRILPHVAPRADLLDAVARAAAAEAEVRRLGLLARSYVLARLMGDDPLDELRAGLEPPKGDGSAPGRHRDPSARATLARLDEQERTVRAKLGDEEYARFCAARHAACAEVEDDEGDGDGE